MMYVSEAGIRGSYDLQNPAPYHLFLPARPRLLKAPHTSKEYHKLVTKNPEHEPVGDIPDSSHNTHY